MGVILALLVSAKVDITLAGGKYEHLMWPGMILVAVAMALTYRYALKKTP
jgi:hypothetical protein